MVIHATFRFEPDAGRGSRAAVRESEEVIRSGTDGYLQFRLLTKDGRLLWNRNVHGGHLRRNGKNIGLRGVSVDITDRKHAEEDLREANGRT
jgi:PAS domain S-box-containing protein